MNQVALENFKIDKSNWKKVKLGDVVFEPKETVKDPIKEGIQHVVGLEHIDSEDIHLRRSASIDESTTFTKKFRKGDVLFGRRRAYLKKAAVADFDGICSGDITVMRAKAGLLPELLPFVINNDKFFDYAVTHSAGGLSPRVKFHDLAKYEFYLPPIKQQDEFVLIFSSLEELTKQYRSLELRLITYFRTFSYRKFKDFLAVEKQTNQPKTILKNLMSSPITNGVFKTSDCFGKGTLLINVTDIYNSFTVTPSNLNRVELTEKEKNTFSAKPGDVIFNRSSLVKEGIGHTCLVPDFSEEMVFECHLMRVRPDPQKLDSRYLCHYCLSVFGRQYLVSRSQTTTMTTINQDALERMPIPLPLITVQKKFADNLNSISQSIDLVKNKISNTMKLQKSFINLIF